MDKYIITITREFGSLGRPLPMLSLRSLALNIMTDIVDEVAKQLNLPVSQISDAEETSHNHFFAHMFPLGTDKQYIQDMIFDVQKRHHSGSGPEIQLYYCGPLLRFPAAE